MRRGAWERGRAAGSGEWRRAPGLQVARKCAALCLLQLQCERRRDNDRGAPVRHAREPVLGEGGDWHPLGTAYSFNTRLSTWFSRHRGPKGVWRGSSTIDGSKPGQPSGVKKDQPVPSLLSAKLQRTGVVQKTHHRRRTRLPLTYHGNSKRAAARLARTSPATSQACRQSWAGRNTATAVF